MINDTVALADRCVTFKQSEMCLASRILLRFAFHPPVRRGFGVKRPKVGRESDMKYP